MIQGPSILSRRARFARTHRRGYVLVMFAMLAWGMMALAALVIDMGMVRLTQRQMQTAADSAALEGLRFRDQVPSMLWNSKTPTNFQQAVMTQLGTQPDPTTAAGREQIRRVAASLMVSAIFDDDLNPSDVDTSGPTGQAGNWGAGPVFDLTGYVGTSASVAAGQLLTVPPAGSRTYNPGQSGGIYSPLQTNYTSSGEQQLYGDMVSGSYAYQSSFDDSHGAWTSYPYQEDPNYQRRDFAASTTVTPGSDSAFLVRLRRLNTHDYQAGVDLADGVSTHGPPLPFLFALGSTMHQNPNSGYSPRQQGVSVRATSIAGVSANSAAANALFTAKTVGGPTLPDANQTYTYPPGASPFALYWSAWSTVQSSGAATTITATVSDSGTISATVNGATITLGFVTSLAGAPIAGVAVGEPLTNAAASAPAATPFSAVSYTTSQISAYLGTGTSITMYAPVLDSTTSTVAAGFVAISVIPSGSTTFRLMPSSSSGTFTIAAQNASVLFMPTTATTLNLGGSVLSDNAVLPGSLLAPALVAESVDTLSQTNQQP